MSGRRGSRRGNVSTIVGLSTFPLVGFTAMAVDWGAVYMAQNQLQMAADAAAVAAVNQLPDQAKVRAVAKGFASQISIQGLPVTLADEDILLGTWDGSTFTETDPLDAEVIKITARSTVGLPMTRLFGVDHVDLTAVAGGGGLQGKPSPDLVIIQDVTGSFSAEIGDARAADLALVNCVHEKADPATKVSLTAFTGFELNLLSPDELVTYAVGYGDVAAEISSLDTCGNAGMPACSGTNIAAGLYLALQILGGSDSDPDVGRAAILVSDGAPSANSTVCQKVNGQYKSAAAAALCPVWGNSPTDTKLKSAALAYRNMFESAGYDLYTVFYNESSNATQSAFMQNLTANDGIYLESPDPADLGDMLSAICKSYVTIAPGLVF